ncbi:MAG TPA: hypothetical protein VGQ84_00245 [Gaiellaceae bacterium]|jgi:hypothetical protein|nr:hypothetical protein [Gaiellaceae bacterium]
MDAAALVLVALLAAAAVLLVARPFLCEPVTGVQPREDEQARERLRLAEQRDRALAALKELEFDHRTGKICDGDYRELVGPLRREAAETLRLLDDRARLGATRRPRTRPAGAARARALARSGLR